MEYVKNLDDNINNTLSQFVRKPTLIRGLIHLLLMLYSARIAPVLPAQVLALFDNQYFKLFVFSLILWTAQFSPSTSILIAVAFLVSVNYANARPLWEFLENTETMPLQAPSKDVALESISSIVNSQMENTPVVNNIEQKQETIIVQPSIIQTPEGPKVVNPSVVIAPAIVETPSGKVVIEPDVSNIVVEQPSIAAPASMPAPMSEPMLAPEPAPMPAPAPEPMPMPAPAPMPEPAPMPVQPKEQLPEPAAPIADQGCYPVRRYDISKVNANSNADEYGLWTA
jgi:hypothetical protein